MIFASRAWFLLVLVELNRAPDRLLVAPLALPTRKRLRPDAQLVRRVGLEEGLGVRAGGDLVRGHAPRFSDADEAEAKLTVNQKALELALKAA